MNNKIIEVFVSRAIMALLTTRFCLKSVYWIFQKTLAFTIYLQKNVLKPVISSIFIKKGAVSLVLQNLRKKRWQRFAHGLKEYTEHYLV